ncbi:NUDIX hydrolase [Frankia sp. Cas3]|uniref:NUDIX hydrolase n=1 Tax=Frankia sp. Cas3 TaxID=3073926 RepID=UPI002AD32347|nr:NUDIX domain-containing protein [Frankia sp. Cas3]
MAMHSVSVGGVVVDDHQRVLVIKRGDNGRLATPGGVLERDEAPCDGLRREVWEETGIPIDSGHLTGVYKNMRTGVLSLVFRCAALAGAALVPSAETPEVMWLPFTDALRLTHPVYAIRISDAFRPDGPFVRLHNGHQLLVG